MQVIYTDRARQGREGYALLQRATTQLVEVAGESADPVTAEWDQTEDGQGHAVFVLRLSDWSGSVTGVFSPEELETRRFRTRLNLLMGRLLQVRSTKLLERLTGGRGGP